MRIQKRSAWCHRCQDHTLHAQMTLNHPLHFFASLLTGGFWLPFWIYMATALPDPVCTDCGAILNQQQKERGRQRVSY